MKRDLTSLLIVIGGILGIILQLLIVLKIWAPFGSIIPNNWIFAIIIIILCAILSIGYGILGWDVGEWITPLINLAIGVFIILSANLAGILLIIEAIMLMISWD